MPISLSQLIDDTLRQDPAKEKHGVAPSWYASQLGLCLRGVFLERMGFKDKAFDARTLRVFSQGKKLEDWVVELLRTHKDITLSSQDRLHDTTLNLVGRPDIIIKYQDQELIYELKSKQSRWFWMMESKKVGPSPNHMQQLWFYLYATGIKEGRLAYISKDDLAIAEYVIRLNDEDLKKEVLGQLNTLNDCWRNGFLPPMSGPKDWQTKYCKNHSLCKKLDKDPSLLKSLLIDKGIDLSGSGFMEK